MQPDKAAQPKPTTSKTVVGWQEWCGLPKLNIPAVKAKIDTGATTSALHAVNIHPFEKNGKLFVRFTCHPLQNITKFKRKSEAPVVEMRNVTNSGGFTENRYVIRTEIKLGENTFTTEITLTNRSSMGYRMLIGRATLRKGYVVDCASSFELGRLSKEESLQLYQQIG